MGITLCGMPSSLPAMPLERVLHINPFPLVYRYTLRHVQALQRGDPFPILRDPLLHRISLGEGRLAGEEPEKDIIGDRWGGVIWHRLSLVEHAPPRFPPQPARGFL
jgi:hypothetical protein